MTLDQVGQFNLKNKKCSCIKGGDPCQWCVDQIFKGIGKQENKCISAHADKMSGYKTIPKSEITFNGINKVEHSKWRRGVDHKLSREEVIWLVQQEDKITGDIDE